MPYQSVNPATGEVLRAFAEHTDEQTMNALAAAEKAFQSWAARPFKERSKIIAKSARLFLEKKEELARLATLEMGKRIVEGRGEVELSASTMQYFADNAEAFLAPKKLKSVRGNAHLEYSPLGVLLSIQPWNYPYYQLARFAGPHLMAGNTMLVKHASGVPQCALAFEQVLQEAGIPEGVYTNLFLSNEQAGSLIDDPRVKGVALTGSERAGEILAARAGKNSSEAALQLILRQIKDATDHGAQILLGGRRAGDVGAFLEPTILTNVARRNPAYTQEFFGPVALIFPAKNEDEAIATANDSPFGLGGSVYTVNIERGKQVARRLQTGMVFINYPDVSAPDLPFGGIKRSGYGKELSNLGLEEFVNKKLVLVPNVSS